MLGILEKRMFRVQDAIDAIRAAPFDGGWDVALEHFTAAGGGWAGQLLGVTHSGELLYDLPHRIDPDIIREFERVAGVDPRLNPRAQILTQAPMRVMVDDDWLSPEEQRRNPAYDFFYKTDGPYAGIVRFQMPDRSSVIAASLRSRRAGQIGSTERRQLEALVPQLEASLRLQHRLDQQGALIAKGVVEALQLAAFLLSGDGRVIGLSSAAEALLKQQTYLSFRGGKVEALHRRSNNALQTAIASACRPDLSTCLAAVGQAVVIQGGDEPIIAEIAPLPAHANAVSLGARAMLTFPDFRADRSDPTGLLRDAFGLTAAEAEVGLAIMKGHSPTDIAAQRGVTVLTVRDQLKRVFLKAGVRSQAALVRLLTRLLG